MQLHQLQQGNAHGNSATASKLATARKITLLGAVSGNANFDGSGNVTINTTQANVAVVTGTLDNTGVASISYPSGFTKDNCVLINTMLQNPERIDWGIGTTFDSAGYIMGAVPLRVNLMNSGIVITAKNINLTNGDPAFVADGKAYNYKIVLMKIA